MRHDAVRSDDGNPRRSRPRQSASAAIRLAIPALCLAAAPQASGGEVELAVHLGRALPYYDQALRYAAGSVPLLPGFSLNLDDSIGLDARGGAVLAAGLTGYVAGPLGFEARVDRARVDVAVRDASFTLLLRGAAPVPPQIASFTSTGSATLDPLTPLSLNLKLRFGRPIRLVVSGGASYLPSFGFTATETIALGPLGVPGLGIPGLGGPSLRLQAGGALDAALGWNGAVAIEVGLGRRAAVVGELRGFVFEERELAWRAANERTLSSLEQALLGEVLGQLEPVRFRPGFYQATAGVALRF